MKKNILLTISLFILLAIAPSQALATIYEFTPPAPYEDLDDLSHSYAYTWGIDFDLPGNEEILSATLSFDNIYNWRHEDNILYIHLLDSVTSGFTQIYEGYGADAIGDYFDNSTSLSATLDNILLYEYTDPIGGSSGATDYAYTFTAEELLILTNFMNNDNFGFGFDPDCHFYNNGVSFSITTQDVHAPEPATMVLFGIGMAGAFVRKRFA